MPLDRDTIIRVLLYSSIIYVLYMICKLYGQESFRGGGHGGGHFGGGHGHHGGHHGHGGHHAHRGGGWGRYGGVGWGGWGYPYYAGLYPEAYGYGYDSDLDDNSDETLVPNTVFVQDTAVNPSQPVNAQWHNTTNGAIPAMPPAKLPSWSSYLTKDR